MTYTIFLQLPGAKLRAVQTVSDEAQAKRMVYARNRAEIQANPTTDSGRAEWSYSANEEPDPREPRDYNDADGIETMLSHG